MSLENEVALRELHALPAAHGLTATSLRRTLQRKHFIGWDAFSEERLLET